MTYFIKTINKKSNKLTILLVFISLSLISCSRDDDGQQIINPVDLPTDSNLVLSCPQVGIDDETCVLDDPNNPYAYSSVSDETKWNLNDEAPSSKSRFYLWATAQAQQQKGENQYYTAVNLHILYHEGGSLNAKEQAKKAYRSVLDNYYGDVTFLRFPDGTLQETLLRNLTAERIIRPSSFGLTNLYDSEEDAYNALRSWGYDYKTTTNTVSRI